MTTPIYPSHLFTLDVSAVSSELNWIHGQLRDGHISADRREHLTELLRGTLYAHLNNVRFDENDTFLADVRIAEADNLHSTLRAMGWDGN